MTLISRRAVPGTPAFAKPVAADPEVVQAYFTQVASYQTDLARSQRRVAILGLAAGTVGLLVGLAGIGAAASMAPLKTVLPLVFRVDNATGVVERVYDVQGGEMAASEATRRYFLWEYVRARQGYQPSEAQAHFEAVSLMSAPAVQQQYAADYRGANPQSPQVLLGRDGSATVKWISTSFLGPKLAQVRFVQQERKGNADLAPKRMVATIAFDFAPGRLPAGAINVNPLGMIVTSYHADQEVTP